MPTIDPTDALVLFADLQTGIADLPGTMPYDRLQRGVRALAKLARIAQMPALLTAVRQDGDGRIMPEIGESLGELPILWRTAANSYSNDAIRGAVEATGRRTLLISGVATEIAVLLPAISFAEAGYRTYIVVDACNGMSPRSEDAALRRAIQCGASTVSVLTLAGELAGEFSTPTGQAAVKVLFEVAGGA